jgi:hypothetical protein
VHHLLKKEEEEEKKNNKIKTKNSHCVHRSKGRKRSEG